MPERIIQANGIQLWTEDFGSGEDIPILLVMGATASAILWDEEFVARLVGGGRYVIRFDNRDTGLSTTFPVGDPGYDLSDMAADAIGVLDAYGLESAHLVGASMGGMICQIIAIEHPSRIRSLTSITATPLGGEVAAAIVQGTTPPLSPPAPEVMAHVFAMRNDPPTTRDEVIDNRVDLFRINWSASSVYPFDEARVRSIVEREHDRATVWAATWNHPLAQMKSSDRTEDLRKVSIPTLVVHGNVDPVLPYDHGLATAEAIQGATLLTMDGVGHALPPQEFGEVAEAILSLTSE